MEYEELSAVNAPLRAMEPGSPVLHPNLAAYRGAPKDIEMPNLAGHEAFGVGDLAAGLAEADYIFEDTFCTQVVQWETTLLLSFRRRRLGRCRQGAHYQQVPQRGANLNLRQQNLRPGIGGGRIYNSGALWRHQGERPGARRGPPRHGGLPGV